MINCIAIDDEPLALTQLTGYISRVPFLNLVASCQDAFDAMSVLSAQKIDLMFVDINMPDLNGMDFVRSLTEKPLVIFTTAYSEYAERLQSRCTGLSAETVWLSRLPEGGGQSV